MRLGGFIRGPMGNKKAGRAFLDPPGKGKSVSAPREDEEVRIVGGDKQVHHHAVLFIEIVIGDTVGEILAVLVDKAEA